MGPIRLTRSIQTLAKVIDCLLDAYPASVVVEGIMSLSTYQNTRLVYRPLLLLAHLPIHNLTVKAEILHKHQTPRVTLFECQLEMK